MNKLLRTIALSLLLAVGLSSATGGSERAAAAGANDVLLSTLQRELQRAQDLLGKLDPPPYFISYSVHDQQMAVAAGSQGSLLSSSQGRTRSVDVIVRVGSPALDNTHEEHRPSAINSGTIPLADDADAISRVLWQLTYQGYRRALQEYLNVKTTTKVNAKEEDTSPDFSEERSEVHTDYHDLAADPSQSVLENMVRRYSASFARYPYIYHGAARVLALQDRWYFVSTEGARVVAPSNAVRLEIEADTQAEDGMELMRLETFQPETASHLPSDAEIAARIDKMVDDLKALRAAPLAEPYNGPALFSGRAAAVFFHEVLGHRLEGQRQRGQNEGQTFTKKLNEPVLPAFLSVIDDPTERTLNNIDLAGWYEYDDEGLPATRVEVIKNGILKGFLMSRMPIKDFAKSNGHGRAQAGMMPIGRQGNLIVTSSRTVKDSELRQKLIDEVKKQGKPYGLYFEDIEGGFTMTQRTQPQAFQVLPILVWRVYPDGRKDELVRGVDIVGTPLTAMSQILMTGEKTEVFNGICGAESGSIGVSAAAPAMLFSDIEVQKQPHSLDRPPILPPPGFDQEEPKAPAKIGDRQ